METLRNHCHEVMKAKSALHWRPEDGRDAGAMSLLQRRFVDLQIVNKTSVRERKVPKAAKMEVKSHLSTLTSVMELQI